MNNKLNMKIAGRSIGSNHRPYVIAEMSANHNGSIDRAFKIIDEAKKAGADAVKLQTYTPDTITLNCDKEDFQIRDGLWKGQTLYELYKDAYMPWDWHKPLFDYARMLDITIFSSPFDETAVDLLEDLNTPAYKIASFETVDLRLIDYVARTGKPMIISTGMASEDEIRDAVDTARAAGCSELALLTCVSSYPALASDYNLSRIADMRERFQTVVGLSDHTHNNTCAIASIIQGGCIIEKHFTLDRNGGGADDSFSLEPNDMRDLCESSLSAWQSIGLPEYGTKSAEKNNAQYRRSLYFVKSLKQGDIIKIDDIRSVRPGFGLPTKMFDSVVGSQVTCNVSYGDPVRLADISMKLDVSEVNPTQG
ncbi:pseudaminic acid synthase [Pseudomonadales bacterium]|nr:pseudaminic acid synthase [Pseudomonadales bacterium]